MTDKRELTRSSGKAPTTESTKAGELDRFLAQAEALRPLTEKAKGRLIFALDATMSRQPSWDLACELQSSMFDAVSAGGTGLDVQLVYFRGFGECRASRWVRNANALRDVMTGIDCRGGRTQLRKVLSHTLKAARGTGVAALIYVGDAMEEDVDHLSDLAGQLGLLGVKAFMFHEGRDPAAAQSFGEIARLTGGVYLPFNSASAAQLRRLLAAIATYAAGGRRALEARGDDAALRLLADMR